VHQSRCQATDLAKSVERTEDQNGGRNVTEPREKQIHDAAVRGCDYATNISPVGTDAHAGTFKDGWVVKDYAPRREGDSPMSQIRNDTEGAVSIEYGTKETPPHHTLASTKVYMDGLAERDIHI
jgi:hypothetical protein